MWPPCVTKGIRGILTEIVWPNPIGLRWILMNILFLDDDHHRCDAFRQRSIGHQVTFVTTADEAIAALQGASSPFDLIMLDHDLEGITSQGTLDRPDNDGRKVCHFMGHNVHNGSCRDTTTIVIHSLNPAGAGQMFNILGKCDYTEVYVIPMAWLKFDAASSTFNI